MPGHINSPILGLVRPPQRINHDQRARALAGWAKATVEHRLLMARLTANITSHGMQGNSTDSRSLRYVTLFLRE